MIQYYKTLKHYGAKEIVIKKSRFIGHAQPVASEEEAVRFVESLQKEHWSATHNCWAYVVGERDEYQKQSDDGEPSGTAGKPILEVIKSQQLKNVAIVVTRYFGGIMLGAGGLIRAYTDGAVAGIEAAEPVWQVLHREVKATVDYHWLGKLENELHLKGILRGETEFTDKVTLTCLPLEPQTDALIRRLTDLTQGQAEIQTGEAFYRAHDELPQQGSWA
ncbi:YigZ family protein [Paenibacillus sp. J31TS4]|uniref:YigZ family protein n=1 Tax=Paenibacillus sp. J31TS4 TaxID=2807195 RepID=UPI001B0DCBB2|nr:YigZ family protein [Paenibacillus sp. J31TS4]GIP38932.1 YigZ family protein [Paenibacillus sp. J31TS4]